MLEVFARQLLLSGIFSPLTSVLAKLSQHSADTWNLIFSIQPLPLPSDPSQRLIRSRLWRFINLFTYLLTKLILNHDAVWAAQSTLSKMYYQSLITYFRIIFLSRSVMRECDRHRWRVRPSVCPSHAGIDIVTVRPCSFHRRVSQRLFCYQLSYPGSQGNPPPLRGLPTRLIIMLIGLFLVFHFFFYICAFHVAD